MNAVFTYAVRYQITACCVTPLRTADADGDTETVLQTADGHYFVQGPSIAGSLRAWLEVESSQETADALFGSQNQTGHLMISDGTFSENAAQTLRPRLRIDGASGSAATGGKFDLAHIEAGATFDFSVTWLGKRSALDELTVVEQMLAALSAGEIQLGAQKTNGFGRVSLTVQRFSYDMFAENDRNAWLDGKEKSPDESFRLPVFSDGSHVIFSVHGHTGGLLVKAAAATHEKTGSYTSNLTEGNAPVIPGSSIKGAVRARTEMIAGYLKLPSAAVETLFGRMAGPADDGKPGQVGFSDVVIENGHRAKISRIRINRFTGGVIRRGLFTEEPVSGTFTLRVAVPEHLRYGCMLLLYALRDLALGCYSLGSGYAIGRGMVAVDTLSAVTPDGRKLMLTFDENRKATLSDPDGLFNLWRGALEEGKA